MVTEQVTWMPSALRALSWLLWRERGGTAGTADFFFGSQLFSSPMHSEYAASDGGLPGDLSAYTQSPPPPPPPHGVQNDREGHASCMDFDFTALKNASFDPLDAMNDSDRVSAKEKYTDGMISELRAERDRLLARLHQIEAQNGPFNMNKSVAPLCSGQVLGTLWLFGLVLVSAVDPVSKERKLYFGNIRGAKKISAQRCAAKNIPNRRLAIERSELGTRAKKAVAAAQFVVRFFKNVDCDGRDGSIAFAEHSLSDHLVDFESRFNAFKQSTGVMLSNSYEHAWMFDPATGLPLEGVSPMPLCEEFCRLRNVVLIVHPAIAANVIRSAIVLTNTHAAVPPDAVSIGCALAEIGFSKTGLSHFKNENNHRRFEITVDRFLNKTKSDMYMTLPLADNCLDLFRRTLAPFCFWSPHTKRTRVLASKRGDLVDGSVDFAFLKMSCMSNALVASQFGAPCTYVLDLESDRAQPSFPLDAAQNGFYQLSERQQHQQQQQQPQHAYLEAMANGGGDFCSTAVDDHLFLPEDFSKFVESVIVPGSDIAETLARPHQGEEAADTALTKETRDLLYSTDAWPTNATGSDPFAEMSSASSEVAPPACEKQNPKNGVLYNLFLRGSQRAQKKSTGVVIGTPIGLEPRTPVSLEEQWLRPDEEEEEEVIEESGTLESTGRCTMDPAQRQIMIDAANLFNKENSAANADAELESMIAKLRDSSEDIAPTSPLSSIFDLDDIAPQVAESAAVQQLQDASFELERTEEEEEEEEEGEPAVPLDTISSSSEEPPAADSVTTAPAHAPSTEPVGEQEQDEDMFDFDFDDSQSPPCVVGVECLSFSQEELCSEDKEREEEEVRDKMTGRKRSVSGEEEGSPLAKRPKTSSSPATATIVQESEDGENEDLVMEDFCMDDGPDGDSFSAAPAVAVALAQSSEEESPERTCYSPVVMEGYSSCSSESESDSCCSSSEDEASSSSSDESTSGWTDSETEQAPRCSKSIASYAALLKKNNLETPRREKDAEEQEEEEEEEGEKKFYPVPCFFYVSKKHHRRGWEYFLSAEGTRSCAKEAANTPPDEYHLCLVNVNDRLLKMPAGFAQACDDAIVFCAAVNALHKMLVARAHRKRADVLEFLSENYDGCLNNVYKARLQSAFEEVTQKTGKPLSRDAVNDLWNLSKENFVCFLNNFVVTAFAQLLADYDPTLRQR